MDLKADIHCHILHCVDDGASGMEEALELLHIEAEQGVGQIYLTPHLRHRMFESPDDEIIRRFKQLKERAADIPLGLHLSREYHFDKMLARAIMDDRLMLMEGNTLLTEFSYTDEFEFVTDAVMRLKKRGIQVLIAHAERCRALWKDTSKAAYLCDMGALLQANAASILGEDGRSERKCALQLLKEDLIYAVASDAHNTVDRLPNLDRAEQFITKKFGGQMAEKLLHTNPMKLIAD